MPSVGRAWQFVWTVVGLLWLGQLLYLGWHFAPETMTLARDLAEGRWGEAQRRQDPLFQEAERLAAIIPPEAGYIFLDHYEAGRDIRLRYFLYPRRQVRLEPRVTPTRLYFEIVRQRASYLILPRNLVFLHLDFLFGPDPAPFRPLAGGEDFKVFQIDFQHLSSTFYD